MNRSFSFSILFAEIKLLYAHRYVRTEQTLWLMIAAQQLLSASSTTLLSWDLRMIGADTFGHESKNAFLLNEGQSSNAGGVGWEWDGDYYLSVTIGICVSDCSSFCSWNATRVRPLIHLMSFLPGFFPAILGDTLCEAICCLPTQCHHRYGAGIQLGEVQSETPLATRQSSTP